MSNDHSNDNGGDGRVYISTQSTGSIYEVAREQGLDGTGSGVQGGLYDGGFGTGMEKNHQGHRYQGGPSDLGNFEAKTADGFRVTHPSQLQPDSIVTIPGFGEVSYAQALEHGLISDRGGQPRAPSDQERAQQEHNVQQQEQQRLEQEQRDVGNRAETDGLGKDAYQVMKQALDKAEGAVLDTAVEIIESGEGTISDRGIVALADALGVQPEQARQHVNTVLAGYERDAVQAAHKATGLHPELITEALRDAYKSRPTEFKEAARRHLNEGGAEAYNRFALEYVAGLAETAPHRLVGKDLGGVRPFGGPNGEILVTANGVTMSWADFIHGGFHKPGRNRR
jgi:hypothetical protein